MSQAPLDLPRARQARSRVTRELIFQAGAALLEEGGAEALTVAAVAARAGVSVGSVYRRFGDKDRLLASLQADFTQSFGVEIIRRFTSSPRARDADPAAVITGAVAGVAETFQAHQRLMRVFMLLGTANEAVLREGTEASVDGGRAFRRFLDPVVPHVRHPDVETAVDFAFRLVYAVCAHRVVHGEHLESPRPLPWPRLTEELAATVRLYLLGELPAGTATGGHAASREHADGRSSWRWAELFVNYTSHFLLPGSYCPELTVSGAARFAAAAVREGAPVEDPYDVAVVGYGPTGMVAASMLGQAGHRVVVLERWASPYGLPRLTHIDDETARAVQAAGDADEALRDSCPTEYLWVNGADETLLNIPAAPAGTQGFPTHISIYQPDIEDSVDRRVRTLPGVAVRRGSNVVGLDAGVDAVALTTVPWRREGEPAVQVRARYVIAADGSKSTVRTLLGIGREDLGFNERWLNIDTEWKHQAPEPFRTTKQYCDPRRGHMFMLIGEKRQRFELALLEGETDERWLHPKAAWDWLRDTHGLGTEDVTIIRQLVYAFEARIATSWRSGRVFLAGDAAHTMPPYMGQGACSGIRDAMNLAWKLDLVLRGAAQDTLLDTYEAERRPHVTAVTHMAIGLGQVANMHDPVAAALRDTSFKAGQAPPPPAMPVLEAGVLHRDVAGAITPPSGDLAPQGHVIAGSVSGRFDDVAGHGWRLVSAVDLDDVLTGAHRDTLAALGGRVIVLGRDVIDDGGVHSAFLARHGAVAYLARPDFTVYGAAARAGDVPALVAGLGAWLAAPARA